MRHRNAGWKFKRSPAHRKMLLRNLATALLEHGKITTTLTKAKAVQPVVEKLITSAIAVVGVLLVTEGLLRAVPRDRPAVRHPSRRLHAHLQARKGPPG